MEILNIFAAVTGYAALGVGAGWLAWLLFQELVWVATKDIRELQKLHRNIQMCDNRDINQRLNKHEQDYKHEELPPVTFESVLRDYEIRKHPNYEYLTKQPGKAKRGKR